MKNFLPLILFLSASCHQKEPEKKEPKAEDSPFSFTVVSGDHPTPPAKFRTVSEAVYPLIKQEDNPAFEPYTETVPRSDNATFDLIPIPWGEFTMGSSPHDPHHKPDELPAHRVHVDSFWMASTETTWALYQNFLKSEHPRNKDGFKNTDHNRFSNEDPDPSDHPVDMISSPTEGYLPTQTGPALNIPDPLSTSATGMTRHSALKFCQWITAQTGHFYRLPTEAEWEYACRAGTTTTFSFGNKLVDLKNHGISYLNWQGSQTYSDDYVNTHPVAKKKANPWGLYDMHGNAGEWTLDAYLPDYSKVPSSVKNPISFSSKLHQGVVRGGSFDSDPEETRSAARLPASQDWNNIEAQNPKSIWYNSSVNYIGFRIVRPLKTPALEEAHLIWNIDSGKIWRGQ